MNAPSPTAERGCPISGRSILFAVTVLLCSVSLYLCHRAIRVMERAVTVMERVDAKMDRVIAAAPSAIERGKALTTTEAEQLKEVAKDQATVAGQKAKDWVSQKWQGQQSK